jgi:type II secretory pathway component PulF
MEFIYKAKDSKGEEKIGKIESRSEDLAVQLLQGYGLTVYDLKAVQDQGFFDKFFGKRRRATTKELSLFLRQFATLLSSKVPLMDSLKTLLAQTSSSGVKDMIFDLISGLDAGLSLSQAMARGESIFSSFYIEMVKSGEISGRLEEVFNYLADYAENEASLNTKAKSAMIYPIFIIVVFILVGAIISITVAPQMMDIFQEFGQNPPFLTKMLIGFGDFLIN